jgi:broad specificity phosphatase PhoE
MKLLLMRHAERESLAHGTPLLTERGAQQAESLQRLTLSGRLPKPSKLWASPQIRTQMTLTPTATSLGLSVQVKGELDERHHPEAAQDFRQRVQKFLLFCALQETTIFLCTHLDWLEMAMLEIPSDTDLLQRKFQSWPPGQHMLFSIQDGLWHLEEFGGLNAHS